MTLVKGVNCYTDVAEANELIEAVFMSNDKERVYWESLSDEDKASIIYKNTLLYDNDDMYYKGYKQDKTQSLQFPRIIRNGEVMEVPQLVKIGLLLQGIKDCMYSSESDYSELKENGIKSFTDGTGAKIDFFGNSELSAINVKRADGMFSGIYELYFKPYTILV